MHSGVYAIHVKNGNKLLISLENYVIMGLVNDNGGQGGTINAHEKKWQPSLGIGSSISWSHS